MFKIKFLRNDTINTKWIYLISAVIFIIVVFFIYWPSMNGSFIWDDDAYITANPLITAKDGFSRIWYSFDHPSQYFPMVYTVFKVEYNLWGFKSIGFHLVNVIIHIINTFLVWYVLSKLKIPGSWLAAIIFAIHPINVESVAWITELKNTMMMFFYLLSFMTWFKVIDGEKNGLKMWGFYLLSFFLFICSLFSKTTACTLPVIMGIVLWTKNIPVFRKQWLTIIPYIIFGIMMGAVTIWWEQVRGASANVLTLNYVERFLVAGKALCFYIEKMFVPFNFMFSYPLWKISWLKPLHYVWIILFSGFLFSIWFLRNKIGKGPCAALLFYAVTLLPVLGFISIYTFYYSYVADHYVYVACIGPFALFSSLVVKKWHQSNLQIKRIITFFVICIIILLSIQTWRQSHIYKNYDTLWADTLKKNPRSLLANANMGTLYQERGDIEQALKYYFKALEIYPDDYVMYYNVGSIFKVQGKLDEAVKCFERAIQILPTYATAHNNLANTLKLQGKTDEAIEHYKISIALQPKESKTYYNLANTYRIQGKNKEAITLYAKAAELEPSFVDARINLAYTLESNGQIKEAITQYQKVLDIDPNCVPVLNAVSTILTDSMDPNIRNTKEAIKYAEKAADVTQNNDLVTLKTLTNAYSADNRKQEAIATAQIAIDLANASNNIELANSIKQWINDNNQPNKK